jgi:glutamyl-tRNA synthetase
MTSRSRSSTPPVGRLAPSPTGGLHVGHARTFLIAWLATRSRGGRIVLRIEDIDTSRVRPGAAEAAIADLQWLGLDWDEGPYAQSERMPAYQEALERLKRSELVYPCTCTRAEIARSASAPHAEDEEPVYPGTCSGRSVAEGARLEEGSFAWRFRVPDGDVSWDDLFLGPISLSPRRSGGDFVVARSPFVPSYQLAVVADDQAMGITQVIRGDDLVPSTPRQMLLDGALGGDGRTYGHVSLVQGADGRRLAKRDGSIKLATLREQGIYPCRLVGWLARSCGWSEDVEPSTPADWIDRYDPTSIPRGACAIDPSAWPGQST